MCVCCAVNDLSVCLVGVFCGPITSCAYCALIWLSMPIILLKMSKVYAIATATTTTTYTTTTTTTVKN